MLCTVGNVVSYGLAYGVSKHLCGLETLKLLETDLYSIFSFWNITTLVTVFSKVINTLCSICQGAKALRRRCLGEGGKRNPVIMPH